MSSQIEITVIGQIDRRWFGGHSLHCDEETIVCCQLESCGSYDVTRITLVSIRTHMTHHHSVLLDICVPDHLGMRDWT